MEEENEHGCPLKLSSLCADWLHRPERGGCIHCIRTKARRERISQVDRGEHPRFYVVAYSIPRHYGGPEEGGWWYDRTSIAGVRSAFTLQGGLHQARELRSEFPSCKRGRGSAIGGADVYIQCHRSEAEFAHELEGDGPGYYC